MAYALVRLQPEASRGAMILDAPLPGIDGWEEIQGHPAMWHVRFMQVPSLAEKLVAGRQADYFSYFFSFGKFSGDDVAHFASAYARPEQLHAVFEMYRAFPTNARFNTAEHARIDVGWRAVTICFIASEGSRGPPRKGMRRCGDRVDPRRHTLRRRGSAEFTCVLHAYVRDAQNFGHFSERIRGVLRQV